MYSYIQLISIHLYFNIKTVAKKQNKMILRIEDINKRPEKSRDDDAPINNSYIYKCLKSQALNTQKFPHL